MSLFPAATVLASSQYRGQAYAPGSQTLLYSETHWVEDGSAGLRHVVLYRCADGTPFARKLITAAPGFGTTPDYRFEDARRKYAESVQRQGAVLNISILDASKQTQRRVSRRDDGLVDAGFDRFVQHNFKALAMGSAMRRPFLLATDFRYLDVRIDDAQPLRYQGQDAIALNMRLDAWYGFVAPRIRLVYARSNAALLEFDGIGTIRRDDGSPLPVRIVFPPAQRVDRLDGSAMQAAEALPLSGRCRLT